MEKSGSVMMFGDVWALLSWGVDVALAASGQQLKCRAKVRSCSSLKQSSHHYAEHENEERANCSDKAKV